jgi:hypothetical protein
MADIINFPDKGTFGEVPVEDVMKGASLLQMVIIMGYDQDGNEYFATSSADIHECYWLTGRFRKFLEEIGDGDDGQTT